MVSQPKVSEAPSTSFQVIKESDHIVSIGEALERVKAAEGNLRLISERSEIIGTSLIHVLS